MGFQRRSSAMHRARVEGVNERLSGPSNFFLRFLYWMGVR